MIKNGYIEINNEIIKKPSFRISSNDNIIVKKELKYINRSALKLLKAIDFFNIDIRDKVCCDIGSSTGGFTEVLLEKKAKKIISVDVGTNQMHQKIRNDERVILLENTNARYLELKEEIDLITCDVSFISIKHLLKAFNNVKSNGEIIILIKPQFEAGKENLVKGIVKDKDILRNVLEDIRSYFENNGFVYLNYVESPIRGTKGNTEFLMYLRKC